MAAIVDAVVAVHPKYPPVPSAPSACTRVTCWAWLSWAWSRLTARHPGLPGHVLPVVCFCVAALGFKSQEAPCLRVKQSEAQRVHWRVGWLPNLDGMVGSWAFSSLPPGWRSGRRGVAKAYPARYGKGTAQTQVRIRNPWDTGQHASKPKVVFLPSRAGVAPPQPRGPQDPDEHPSTASWLDERKALETLGT